MDQRKEHLKIRMKKYREDHKEHIKELDKKYSEEHKEQKKAYREQHKEHIQEQSKKYREEHKDEKIDCLCGTSFLKKNKARHLKSGTHLQFNQLPVIIV